MRSTSEKICVAVCASVCAVMMLSGCQSAQSGFAKRVNPPRPFTDDTVRLAESSAAEAPTPMLDASKAVTQHHDAAKSSREDGEPEAVTEAKKSSSSLKITPVSHFTDVDPADGGFVSINGRSYEIQLVPASPKQSNVVDAVSVHESSVRLASQTHETTLLHPADGSEPSESFLPPPDTTLMNLPTALSLVGGDHPAVGFARWRVREAYAQLDQAEALWLPSLQVGFSFHRHDGNYQASNGAIVDVNRNSFQYGLGAGATGAGTTPRPGLRAQFHLADAIFQPEIAQKTAWAQGHAENATVNRQLRDVALAYLELLNATQRLRIVEESRERLAAVAKLTDDFAAVGEGLQADADRITTELVLIDSRIVEAQEAVDVASARLAHAMSADPNQRIVPMDTTLVPLNLVSIDRDRTSLIQTGLSQRPELKQAQALVAAACDRHQRERYAPFVPSVLLGLSAGGFGGGNGNSLNNIDNRYDFDAVMTWEVRNLGFGERAARSETAARVQQAMFRRVRQMDDVAREIDEAFTQVQHRNKRIAVTQPGLQTAEDSFTHNLQRIRNGEGLPIEVLQSVQAMETARLAYTDAIVAFNEAQFRLQWALGWPVTAPPE